MNIADILALGQVMPVLVIDDATHALPLADALLEGGIRAIEITLRTPASLDAIREISTHRQDILVGAGTILSRESAKDAARAGAQFAVSPGSTPDILSGCKEASLPLLPGVSSVSEMLILAEQGYHQLKFFPASTAGGIGFLKSLASPLPHLTFCPTGGITEETTPNWLALSHVVCVGGSWVAPPSLIKAGLFADITALAKKTHRLENTH